MSSGLLGMIGSGLSGLNAAQAGLLTTQQNITNVNTPGYNRQEAIYASQTPSYSSSGWIGNGVAVASVQRVYSQFLDNQVQTNQSQLSYYQTYSTVASQVDSLLGSSTNGLSNQIDAFFSAANEVANSPTSTAARQTLLSGGQSLSNQISNTHDALQQQLTASNQAVTSLTAQINTYARQIATLNQNITSMQAQNGQPPNDLLDQRNLAVTNLNGLVNATTSQQSNGQIDVYIGNGQALVSGSQVNQLTATPDPNDTSNTQPPSLVPQMNASGTQIPLSSSQISGGELGGWMASRDGVVKPAMANLNRLAVSIGAAVNQVQTSGAYYNSSNNTMQAGSNFFSGVVQPTGTTTDAIGIKLSSNVLVNSNYAVTYHSGTNQYTLTSAAGSDTQSAGTEFSINGVAQGFSITAGTPAPSSSSDTWSLNIQDYAATMTTLLGNSSQIAAASLATGAHASNTGTGTLAASQLSATGLQALSASAPVTLTYDSTLGQFAVSGATPPVANIAYTSPGPQTLSFNGISLAMSGSPANGDAYTVNTPGPGDNSNMLALSALQTTKLLDNGNTTLGGGTARLVGDVATSAANAALNSTTYGALKTQATQAQQSYSGVNLDEEAANLIRYQQAYQAAAKALSVASTLFAAILAISP